MSGFNIPVLFQVEAQSEPEAAYLVAQMLEDRRLVGDGWQGREIESWHMPNLKYADGSDEPFRVVIEAIPPNDRCPRCGHDPDDHDRRAEDLECFTCNHEGGPCAAPELA